MYDIIKCSWFHHHGKLNIYHRTQECKNFWVLQYWNWTCPTKVPPSPVNQSLVVRNHLPKVTLMFLNYLFTVPNIYFINMKSRGPDLHWLTSRLSSSQPSLWLCWAFSKLHFKRSFQPLLCLLQQNIKLWKRLQQEDISFL